MATILRLLLLTLALAAFADDDEDEDWMSRRDAVRDKHREAVEESRRVARVRLQARIADNRLARQLEMLQVTQLEAKGITLPDIISDIRKQAMDAGMRGFNVIYRCDGRKLKRPIDLSLENIPFLSLLDSLTDSSRLAYVIEPYALVIIDKPRE